EGVGGMLARGYLKLSADQRGFERTLMALRCFHRAHGYFQRVVSEYPDSIWARDAGYRLHRIERFNVIYRRIQKNLQDRLARAEHEHPAGSAKSQRESSAESNQSAIVDEQ
ncbi:MAG: hypothetical protein KDK34_06035, partial [Leptospiraceae bacterium]|nr:hypothetical protein [Leptospiraceae bacterium]